MRRCRKSLYCQTGRLNSGGWETDTHTRALVCAGFNVGCASERDWMRLRQREDRRGQRGARYGIQRPRRECRFTHMRARVLYVHAIPDWLPCRGAAYEISIELTSRRSFWASKCNFVIYECTLGSSIDRDGLSPVEKLSGAFSGEEEKNYIKLAVAFYVSMSNVPGGNCRFLPLRKDPPGMKIKCDGGPRNAHVN